MRTLHALGLLGVFFLMHMRADAEAVGYPLSTEEANVTYTGVMQQVLNKLGANETFAHNVVVFYPGEKCEEYAVGFDDFKNTPKPREGDLVEIEGYEGVIVYAVKYRPDLLANQSLEEEWDKVQRKKDKIIEKLYDSTFWRRDLWGSDKIALCGSLNVASITLTDSTGGFYAVVVFQCARRFVWYELGWRYYQAYATTSDYVIRFEQSSPWDNNCGAIVFFP